MSYPQSMLSTCHTHNALDRVVSCSSLLRISLAGTTNFRFYSETVRRSLNYRGKLLSQLIQNRGRYTAFPSLPPTPPPPPPPPTTTTTPTSMHRDILQPYYLLIILNPPFLLVPTPLFSHAPPPPHPQPATFCCSPLPESPSNFTCGHSPDS